MITMSQILKLLMQEQLEALQEELKQLFEINEDVAEHPRLVQGAGFWQPVAEIDRIIFEMKCLAYPEDYSLEDSE